MFQPEPSDSQEPWNPDRPDLLRVGVEAAAKMLHGMAVEHLGEVVPDFDEFRAEWEEDAVRVLRAYQKAAGWPR